MSTKVVDVFGALTLDLKGYRSGIKQAVSEGEDAGKRIDKAVTLKTLLADVELGRKKMLVLRDAGGLVASTLKNVGVSALNKGLSTAKSLLGDLAKGFAIGAGIGSFQAIGNALSDVLGFIPSLIEKGKQYGLLVDSIGDSTGATAEASSRLAGTLLFLGAPVGSIVNLLGQMSRNLEDSEPRLQALGVVTRDANDGLLNQVQILENARQAFSRYGDGTAKADQIAREFGRGGLQILVDYLHLTDEQAKAVTDDLQRQGLILTESQRNLAESSQRESNRLQNALTGLGVALFTTVGPQISAFFSNLTDEIEAHAAEISNAISSAISFIVGLVSALTGAGTGLDSFAAGVERGNAVTSPYSARLLQLSVELANLNDSQKTATNSTDGQRKAIQAQIDTVDKEISKLKALEAQQDKTYKKALDGLNAQLDAQESLLDAEDRAAARADRDIALTRSLADAKRTLFEAQAQLRADTLAGKPVDQDTLAIADAQRGVLDAQKAIGDESRRRTGEDRRAQIVAVKDYIASVQKLLEDADNKKAALNTLRRREAVLQARQEAQLAAGDVQGAGDTGLQLEAVKTTETRAQEQIRNGIRQTAVEKQKAQLQEELSNIRSASEDATAIRKADLEKQIAGLKRLSESNLLVTEDGKKAFRGLAAVVRGGGEGGETGLTQALREARKAGIDFGNDVKDAVGGLVDALTGLFGWLGDIKTTLDDISKNDVFKFLTQPIDLGKLPSPGDVIDTVGNAGRIPGTGFDSADLARLIAERGGSAVPHRDSGGWVDKGLWFNDGPREYVLPNSLAEKLDRAFSGPQMPAMAAVGGLSGGSGGDPVILRVEIGGNRLMDYIDQGLRYRRR